MRKPASVLEAAEELGYVPTNPAAACARARTNIIGFMMQTGTEITGQGDTFFMSVFDGVQTVFARHVSIWSPCSARRKKIPTTISAVSSRGFADGVILSATQRHDPRFEFLAKRKIPFVTLGRSLTDAGQPGWTSISKAWRSLDRPAGRQRSSPDRRDKAA
jgi:DNA-binding LacI/PurR family transcriptional regulator